MRTLAVFVVLSLLLVGCSGESGEGAPPTTSSTTATGSELPTVTIEASSGEEVEVRVEIADSRAERSRGLMGRTTLAGDRGMLFVYGEERELSFWMKNTLIPLSIAFIDADGRIVSVQEMEPLDDEPPNYTSPEPVPYALEVNQGFFEERGVEVGDTAELPE